MSRKPDALLKSALAINLVLSIGTGLTATMFASAVAALIGNVPAWFVMTTGIGLLGFAAGIAWTLARLRIGEALLISGLDVLWVLSTLPLILVPGLLAPTGIALVIVLALAVGTLGVLQLLGIRRILATGVEPGQYRHCIRVRSSADPEKLWRVVRDLGAMSRYSAGLSASRLEGGSEVGPGSVRVCTNTNGQSWAEEVETFDDRARSVFFRFRSEADDFPFPLAALSGGWTVASDRQDGALVDIWWIVTPKQRHFGWVIVALMTMSLDRTVPDIVAAMQADATGQRLPVRDRKPALAYC